MRIENVQNDQRKDIVHPLNNLRRFICNEDFPILARIVHTGILDVALTTEQTDRLVNLLTSHRNSMLILRKINYENMLGTTRPIKVTIAGKFGKSISA